MTRAEQKAEEYDKSLDYLDYISDNLGAIAYQKGYEQAEKDTMAWVQHYILTHDTIDIIKMEDEFNKEL